MRRSVPFWYVPPAGLELTEMLDTQGLLPSKHFPMSWRGGLVSEQGLQRQAKHRLAAIRVSHTGCPRQDSYPKGYGRDFDVRAVA